MQNNTMIKDILLYLLRPEDTTEAGGEYLGQTLPLARQHWLGPLKAVFWSGVAVAGPLLFCLLLL